MDPQLSTAPEVEMVAGSSSAEALPLSANEDGATTFEQKEEKGTRWPP